MAAAAPTGQAQLPMNSEVIMDTIQVVGLEQRMKRYLLSRAFL
uniref:Zinc finger protein 772 n=1 Tax=Saimiri boliviensis boliviensis TaxID=39432 RepID=A0A2K6SS83_SAIBB